jgi:hypothetical protein
MLFNIIMMSAFAEETQTEEVTEKTEITAVPEVTETANSSFYTNGSLRLNATSYPGFVVDFEGRTLEAGMVADSRLRGNVGWKQSDILFEIGGDLFQGQFAGTPWNIAADEHRYRPDQIGILDREDFVLRSAQVKKKIGVFGFQSGVTTSHWGLGLVSNDGNHDKNFSRTDYGDRVYRTSVYGMPVDNIIIMLGGDWVLEDDIGGFTDGQDAYQGLGSVQLISSDKNDAMGLLAVYRHQTKDERVLKGTFIDFYAKTLQHMGPMELYAATEIAYLHGDHGQVANRNNPEGLKVRSYGGVGELEMRHRHGIVGLNAGFASGDANSSDDVYSAFSFDRDYNAGSVLFDFHQAAREVAEYDLLTDPEHSGTPPDGIEFAVTEGTIRQAMFLQPSLTITKLKSVDIAVGSVFAWSTTPIRAPFVSYRNGGADLNHLGQATDGYKLGTELNWAVTLHHKYESGLKNALSLGGAHLLPSTNLGNEDALSMIRLQANTAW